MEQLNDKENEFLATMLSIMTKIKVNELSQFNIQGIVSREEHKKLEKLNAELLAKAHAEIKAAKEEIQVAPSEVISLKNTEKFVEENKEQLDELKEKLEDHGLIKTKELETPKIEPVVVEKKTEEVVEETKPVEKKGE